MQVNVDDPSLYEDLQIIVQAFESGALKSGKREAILAVTHNSLEGIKATAAGSRKTLETSQGRLTGEVSVDQTGAQARIEGGFSFDADLVELMFPDGPNGDSAVANYLNECLNCNGRVAFNWQLRPFNLLEPIDNLIQQLSTTLDRLEARLDPLNTLDGICGLMNQLRGFCIPDLILVLMSIKMLIKKYTTNALDIKLDWTVVLGPLLKVILEGVVSLLNNLVSVALTPLDCVAAAMATAESLESQGRELLDLASSIGQGNFLNESDVDFLGRDYSWNNTEPPGRLEAHVVPVEEADIPTTFSLKADMSLEDAINDPAFVNSTLLQKLLIPLQEAKRFIKDLLSKLTEALDSLNGLVGSGLSINLNRLGILLFLVDIVSVVMVIIRMFRQNRNITDWCAEIQENPGALESALRERFGNDIGVEKTNRNSLILRKGPDIAGEIGICENKRSVSAKSAIASWIKELE